MCDDYKGLDGNPFEGEEQKELAWQKKIEPVVALVTENFPFLLKNFRDIIVAILEERIIDSEPLIGWIRENGGSAINMAFTENGHFYLDYEDLESVVYAATWDLRDENGNLEL